MKHTPNTKFFFIGLIALFAIVVVIVEVVKNAYQPGAIEDRNSISQLLLFLPIIAITVLFVVALPRLFLHKEVKPSAESKSYSPQLRLSFNPVVEAANSDKRKSA